MTWKPREVNFIFFTKFGVNENQKMHPISIYLSKLCVSMYVEIIMNGWFSRMFHLKFSTVLKQSVYKLRSCKNNRIVKKCIAPLSRRKKRFDLNAGRGQKSRMRGEIRCKAQINHFYETNIGKFTELLYLCWKTKWYKRHSFITFIHRTNQTVKRCGRDRTHV